jgi:uncharacterized membrane protein YphA (DoxX/SURF4 family)
MAGHSTSSLIAPIFIRLALGATLLWSGIGLVSAKVGVEGERAAALANMGVVPVAGASAAPAAPKSEAKPEPAVEKPVEKTPEKPKDTGHEQPPLMQTAGPEAASPAKVYGAADFAEPVEVARMHATTARAYEAAHPRARADGTAPRALWPVALTRDRWPVVVAWTVSLGMLVGGAMVMVGLFTRLAAAMASIALFVTLWLTMIVPAVHAGTAQWGFIPPGGAWELNAAGESVHGAFMWLVLQLAGAVSLVFAGAGYLSLDRLLFPGGEEAPKAKVPARATPGD